MAQSQDNEPTGTNDETLRLMDLPVDSLDPIHGVDNLSGMVIRQLFEGLFHYPNGELELEPLLVADYEVSDDYTTYTFTLKEDVVFHDGTELTASDFTYAWERVAASDHSRRSHFLLDVIGVEHETDADGEYVPGSLAVEATDQRTIELQLERPFHSTLEVLAYTAFVAVPEGIVGDVEGYEGRVDYDTFARRRPIGTGPFEIDFWRDDREIQVTAFDEYHGADPTIDNVHWRMFDDSDEKFDYAMDGDADAFGITMSNFDPDKVTVEEVDGVGRRIGTYGPVRNGETLDYVAVPTLNVLYLAFDTESVPKPVRQATAYAIDQSALLEDVFKGRGRPAYHLTPPAIYPGGPDAYDADAKQHYPYGHDSVELDAAREVMEAAGYGPDERATFTFTYNQTSGSYPELGLRLQRRLADVYADVELEAIPYSELHERGRNGNLDAYPLGWLMDWPAPDSFLQQINPARTDTSKPDPLSYVNWSGTDAADSAAEAWKTIRANSAPADDHRQRREDAYVAMERANWEDAVIVPLYHEIDPRFSYPEVELPPFGPAGIFNQRYDDVRIDRDE